MSRLTLVTIAFFLLCTESLFAAPSLTDLANSIDSTVNRIAAGDFRGPVELNPPGFHRALAKVYFPNQYESQAEWPLVILLHGLSATGEAEDLYFGLRFRTSRRGFILVTPEGTKLPPGTFAPQMPKMDLSGSQFWNATDVCCDLGKSGVDDVKYLNSLIAYLTRHYRVDARRIYLFGHSNGGFMANRMACESGQKFAAIATLAAGSFKNPDDCRHPVPVPYLHIHSVNDALVAYRFDKRFAAGLPTVQQWLKKNRCSPQSIVTERAGILPLVLGPSVELRTWKDCSGDSDVNLWTIAAWQGPLWNPHLPLITWAFTEDVLDYLFAHQR